MSRMWNMHVRDPYDNKAWCGADGEITAHDTVNCPDCINKLFSHPGYYNQLRAKGLRTKAERELEETNKG